jgi:hypothetical protein
VICDKITYTVTHGRALSISLEFGHAMLVSDGSLNRDELRQSCSESAKLRANLEESDANVDITSWLLIDDKKIAPGVRSELGDRLIAYLKEFTSIDYYCYERDLMAYVEPMLACLTPRVRTNQEKLINRHFAKGLDTLACPVDIAIWYLLRLGVLKDTNNIIKPLDASVPYQSTDIVVSVLPDYLRTPERIAMSRILRHIINYPDICDRIKPVYFPYPKLYSVSDTSRHVDNDLSHATSHRSLVRLVAASR